MAEVIGAGVTHFPGLALADKHLGDAFRWALTDPDLPDELRDPAGWTSLVRQELGDDDGLEAATRHAEALRQGFRTVREALDSFQPDLVVIWGDDQYELFRDELIPAFAVCVFDDMTANPWKGPIYAGRANRFGEDEETTYKVLTHRPAARHLVDSLLGKDVDVAYACEPQEGRQLPAAWVNTLRYLDWDGGGFPYPSVFVSVNCHGSRLIKTKGAFARMSAFGPEGPPPDPPSPSPKRCFDVGAAIGETFASSSWRVALVASSSWSHSFLTEHTMFLRPDGDRDRMMYGLLEAGKLEEWKDIPLKEVERAGQHEMLNWFCLAGAVVRLGLTRRWSEFIESDLFASNKCFAIFDSPDEA